MHRLSCQKGTFSWQTISSWAHWNIMMRIFSFSLLLSWQVCEIQLKQNNACSWSSRAWNILTSTLSCHTPWNSSKCFLPRDLHETHPVYHMKPNPEKQHMHTLVPLLEKKNTSLQVFDLLIRYTCPLVKNDIVLYLFINLKNTHSLYAGQIVHNILYVSCLILCVDLF